MTIILALLGAFVGGTNGNLVGVLTGGTLGFLCGRVYDLGQELAEIQHELTRLRERRERGDADARTGAVQPMTRPLREPASPEPVDQDPGYVREYCRAAPPERQDSSTLRSPKAASPPSPAEEWLRTLFSGENLLVKVGVVVLFFGVSFLVKYAAQRGLFPLELRLAAAALGGCSLLGIGWLLLEKRPVYAQVLQGGGVGILYLTTYASLTLYHLIPTGLGLFLLVAISALSAFLAVVQDSRALAFMGSAGGFVAPELASIGSSGPFLLFSYYAVLNVGILAIARLRAWRELDLLGFISTFIVSALWGSRFYSPTFFCTVEPFLVLYFLIYAVLPVLHARQQPIPFSGSIDCTLVFATPVIAFFFQAALVRQYQYGLAWSALAVGIFYVTVAMRLFRTEPLRMRSLAEAFLAMGTVFGTLAIPLAFDGRWTSAAWSIESAALIWTGLRQERRLARGFGCLLLIGSGMMFFMVDVTPDALFPILNSTCLGSLMVSVAALGSSWLLGRSRSALGRHERFMEPVLFAWGVLWWFFAGWYEVQVHTRSDLAQGALMTFVAGSCYACTLLRKRLDWQLPEWPALGLLPAMAGFALLQLVNGSRYPSLHGGWFGWPLVIAAWYLVLWSMRSRTPQLPGIVHAAPFWIGSLLVAWEVSGRITRHLPGMDTWALCAWGVVPALVVLLMTSYGTRFAWPVRGNLPLYLLLGCGPVAGFAWHWVLCANGTSAGNPWPLPYVAVFNPLDGTTLLVLISLVAWYRTVRHTQSDRARMVPQQHACACLAATTFIWLNAVLLRSIHHWCGVPFTLSSLFSSLIVQATLSITWCLLALAVMLMGTRRRWRHIWLVGAGLLGVVVGKLFLVDLAGHGSVARIISFLVVGLLILLIGWFSPVPPKPDADQKK